MKKWIIPPLLTISCLGLWGIYTPIQAREKPNFNTLVDRIHSQQVEKVDYEVLREHLWEVYQHPLDLNHASQEDLKLLGILTDQQLTDFFEHLEKNGPLVSIYELQAIPSFDLTTIYQLLPFIQVQETYPQYDARLMKLYDKGRKHSYWLNQYERNLSATRGYEPNEKTGIIPYAGSPDKIATRIQYRHPLGISWGILGRKFPGEAFTWDPSTARYGLDLWSAYCLLEQKGLLKKLILGDYQVGYGQGLVVNAGFSMDKSSETILIMRTNNLGIKPHTAFSHYGLRGIALTLLWKQLELTTYYASTNLDGRIMVDTTTNESYVESIQRHGLHRTSTEINKKGQVNEQMIGSTLLGRTQTQNAELGINALHTHYNIPIHPNPKKKSEYSFSGQDNFNIGLFYKYLWQNLHFFGEGALCASGGKAILVGMIAGLSAKADASFLLRHYDPNFHSPCGDAFRENASSNSNEQGIYVGLKLQPTKKLNLYTYYDYFKSLAPTPTIAEPTSGYNWLAKATYQPRKPTLLRLQYKTVNKARDITRSEKASQLGDAESIARGIRHKYTIQLKHAINSRIDLNSEAQWSHYTLQDQTTWGYALVQRVSYHNRKWSITGQTGWFDTDYENGLFFYEKDVMFGRSMPSLYYKKGMKYSIVIGYKPTSSWRLELVYALTWYMDGTHRDYGTKKMEGNTKNELRLQTIYKF